MSDSEMTSEFGFVTLGNSMYIGNHYFHFVCSPRVYEFFSLEMLAKERFSYSSLPCYEEALLFFLELSSDSPL